MKWVVFFLLVVNFALLGFYQASSYMADSQDAAATPSPAPPPYTGPIKLLSAAELEALPKKAPESTPAAPLTSVVATCYEWGSFNPAVSPRVLAALKKLDLQATAKAVPKLESTRYWVYIPPLKTQEQAQAKDAEIKAMGVEESLIMQDAQWRNAISLGVFKDESLADRFIDKLHGMGVKNAVKVRRGQGNHETSYIIRHVLPGQAVKLAELKPHFSAGELKQIDCK